MIISHVNTIVYILFIKMNLKNIKLNAQINIKWKD
jgi:hypothetical protein